MAGTDKLFAGNIPETYDRFLVPLIFEAYARDLAERVAETEPHDVLETAAGTGVLTRALASRLPGSFPITRISQCAQSARFTSARRRPWRPSSAPMRSTAAAAPSS